MQPVSEPRAQTTSTVKKGDCGGSLRKGRAETLELVQDISRLRLLTDPFETCHLRSLFTKSVKCLFNNAENILAAQSKVCLGGTLNFGKHRTADLSRRKNAFIIFITQSPLETICLIFKSLEFEKQNRGDNKELHQYKQH